MVQQQSLYDRVYQSLRQRIISGEIAVGDRLPSQTELTAEFDVSTITVKRALDMLSDDGLVLRRPRIGTVVVSKARSGSGRHERPLVGYVVPDFDDAFGSRLLIGLIDGISTDGHLTVSVTHGDAAREHEQVERQLERGVGALVLLPSSSQFIPPAVMSLVARQFPIVVVDRTLTGVPVSTVTSDNVAGGRLATEHLFDLGHDTVALALSPNAISSLDERRRGFVAAHAAHHVRLDSGLVYDDVRSVVPGTTTSPDDDVERLARFLAARPDVTGIVVTEYHSARLVLQAAQSLGRRVPQDMSVVCFDAPPEFVDAALPLTHIQQDQYAIGQRAAQLALAQLRDPAAVSQELVPVELVQGATTGPRLRSSAAPAAPGP